MQSSIVSEAKAIENELIAHRRHLHQNPELGFDLPETTAYVMQQLREYGYEPKAVGKAGISAVIGPDGGKTFFDSRRYGCTSDEGRDRIAVLFYQWENACLWT